MNRFRVIVITLIAAGCIAGVGISQASSSASNVGSTPAPPQLAQGSAQHFRVGGHSDAGSYGWALSATKLAVTRDGGQYWSQLPLPPTSAQITGVATLPTQTVVVAPSSEGTTADVEIHAAGSGAWENHAVPAGIEVGPAEVVEAGGALAGVMINEPVWGGARRGTWLGTPDAGETWQASPTPTTGAVTDAGGLWLVGGSTNSAIYHSTDNGATWQPVTLPVTLTSQTPVALSPVEASGETLVLTATTTTSETQVITGTESDGEWHWSSGPVLKLGGEYGSGTPARTSLAEGVLWILGPLHHLARVTLATGKVSEETAENLPANGEITLHATGPETAWASYSTTSCAEEKAGCTEANGFLASTNGGASWHEIAGPPES